MILLNFNKERRIKFFFYFLAFILSKSAVFLAPLLLSNYLDVVSYGKLEYGISIGGILSMVLGLGVASVYPIIILTERKINYFSSFFIYIIGLLVLGTLLGLLSTFFPSIQSNIYSWAILIGFILTAQSFFSVIYKTHSKQLIAVFLDSGFYIFLATYVLFIKYVCKLNFYYLFDLLLLYFVILTAFWVLVFKHRIKFSKENWIFLKKIMIKGYPLIVSSFIIMTFINSGRILIERFCSKIDLAEYSFYFRLASIILLFYQFANIMFYKKMYIASAKKIDKYFTMFLLLLLTLNISAFFIIPIVGKEFLKLLSDYNTYKELYFLLVVFVPLWNMNALNETLIYKENLTWKMNRIYIILLITSLIMLLIINHFRDLVLIDYIKAHLTILFLFVQVQIILLKKKGFSLPKLQIATVLIFVFTFIIDNVLF